MPNYVCALKYVYKVTVAHGTKLQGSAYSGHISDSRVSTPVVGFVPRALGRPHRYISWSLRRITSLKSAPSILAPLT